MVTLTWHACKYKVHKLHQRYILFLLLLNPLFKVEIATAVSKQTWCLTSTETIRLIRDGEKGGGGMEWGEREIIYLSLHCHHQNDSCIKMGSDESHFNVSVGSDGQSHKTVSTDHNLFEKKGEPKRYRTEVLPLTSLTPYR